MEEYYKYKQSVCSHAGEKDKSVKSDQWPIGTAVTVGDSILNGIVEEKSCGQGRLIKSKCFPGSTVDDLSHHIIPITWKKPTNMIIYTGTNDAPSSTFREIQDKLLKLKALVNEKLPQYKVWLSTPTLWTDNGKATLTVTQLVNDLLNLNIDVIDNRNIKSRHLSLHLNDSGSKLLARDILGKIKLFWVDERCSSIIKDSELGYLSKNDRYDIQLVKLLIRKNTLEKIKILVKFWMI